MKILLVEDNDDNRDMLLRRLTQRGYAVVVAATGTDALSQAQQELPDVILMDVSLPDFDGLEATRRLKSETATRAIPVIALTAHATAGDREQALAAGCDDYDTQPIEFERLVGKIEALRRC